MQFAAFIAILACFFAVSQALSLRAPDAKLVRLPKIVFPHTGKDVSSLQITNDDAADDDFLSVFPRIELQEKQRKR